MNVVVRETGPPCFAYFYFACLFYYERRIYDDYG